MIDPKRMARSLRRINVVSMHYESTRSLIEDAANMIEHLAAAVDVPGFNAGIDACIAHCNEVYAQRKNGTQELSFDKRHLQLGEQYAYKQMAKHDLPALKLVPEQEQTRQGVAKP